MRRRLFASSVSIARHARPLTVTLLGLCRTASGQFEYWIKVWRSYARTGGVGRDGDPRMERTNGLSEIAKGQPRPKNPAARPPKLPSQPKPPQSHNKSLQEFPTPPPIKPNSLTP